MLDRLRGMAVFAKVVQTGSFRAAAKALALSPSVVSHHVAQLEAALDAVLLYRNSRRIALTAHGEKLFAVAQELLQLAEGGFHDVATASERMTGRLSVAAPAGLATGPLMDDFAAFAREHPKVELCLSFSDVTIDIVALGVDVAIRGGALRDSGLKTKRLFDIPRTLVASPEYIASRPKPKHPNDLAKWDWIRLGSRPAEATFFHDNGSKVRARVQARIVADNAVAMAELAKRGLGLAPIPSAIATPDLAGGRLTAVLPAWRLESPPVYAVWPANVPRSAVSLKFVAYLEERSRKR